MTKRLTKLEYEAVRDAKVVASRVAAGGSTDRCPTCTRDVRFPYRVVVEGRVVEGCIDACHTPHVTLSSREWHNRDVARNMRRDDAKRQFDLDRTMYRERVCLARNKADTEARCAQ